MKKLLGSFHNREEGITGLETAIILIAFVIVASVFAFVVLSTGLFSADRGKETVFAGLDKARGNLEVRGAITAATVGAGAEVACEIGLPGVDDDADGRVNDGCATQGAAAETGAQCTNTIDDDPVDDGVGNETVNDGCPAYALVQDITFNLASAAAGAPVSVDPAATTNTTVINYVDAEARVADVTYTVVKVLGDADDLIEVGELFEITVDPPGTSTLEVNEVFTIEVVPPSGGTLTITRTMPPQKDALVNLN